jgi:hypothetical protein
MRSTFLLLSCMSLLLVSCASRDPFDSYVIPDSEESFAQFQSRAKAESNGTSSSFVSQGNSRYRSQCIGKENLDFDKGLRGKCYFSNCHRVGNSEKCEEIGLEIKNKIEAVQAESEKQKEKEREQERKQKHAKCFSGDLQICIDWIHFESPVEYDVLGKMCESKNNFQCTTKYEKLNVENFNIKCQRVGPKIMTCEEIYKEQFAFTTVRFLR